MYLIEFEKLEELIKQDLIEGQTEKCLNKLDKFFQKYPPVPKEITLITARNKINNSSYRKGTISTENFYITKNQINESLLNFLNETRLYHENEQLENVSLSTEERIKSQIWIKVILILTILLSILIVLIKWSDTKYANKKTTPVISDRSEKDLLFCGIVKDFNDSSIIPMAKVILALDSNSDTLLTDSAGVFDHSFAIKYIDEPIKLTILHNSYQSNSTELFSINERSECPIYYLKRKAFRTNERDYRSSSKQNDFVQISGNVTDLSGLPLNNVNINVVGASIQTRTDSNGYFQFIMENNNLNAFRLQATRNGYRSWNHYIQNPLKPILIKIEKE